MNSQKFDELFAAALEIAPAERNAFLAAECAGDEPLQKKIQALLQSDAEAADAFFLAEPAVALDAEILAESRADSQIGNLIGHYKIVGQVGAGGMGTIYRAERADGNFEKQVALKLVKRGMDTEAILRRFFRERQILANLEHPNIARLLDAGMTDDGLPFFVMELVEGLPIDEFCRERNLSDDEKLRLFRTVCLAVAHAHRSLIVHRDLKPSNILITTTGEPKLLDFGIAKLLGETEAEHTQTHLRILTPAYAAPEQKSGEVITTATDVYSLGLILSELFGGAPPGVRHPSSKNSVLEAFTRRTTTTNNQRQMKALPDDLQKMLQTALREEPARRYGSAEKFADDIGNYLNDLPISAQRDTFFYRGGKFVKRHRLAVASTALVFLAVTGGVAATLWQAQIAQSERRKAEQRAENLQKISYSFVVELHDEIVKLPGSLTVRQMLLQRGVEQLDQLASETQSDANLQDELAQGYYRLGEMPDLSLAEIERNRRKGMAIYQELLVREPDNVRYRARLADGYARLADIQKIRGDIIAGLDFARRASSILESVVSSDESNPEYLAALWNAYYETAGLLDFTGDGQEGLTVSRKAFALAEKLVQLDPGNANYREMKNYSRIVIATSLSNLGDYEDAFAQIQMVYAEFTTEFQKEPANVINRYKMWAVHRRIGVILAKSRQYADSLKALQNALRFIEKLAAQSPSDDGYRRNTSFTHLTIAQTLISANQPERAEPHLRCALDLSEKILIKDAEKGETIADLGMIHGNLGEVLTRTEKRAEGLRHLHEAIGFFEKLRVAETGNRILQESYHETLGWLENAAASDSATKKK